MTRMTQKNILLETAAFLDSPWARPGPDLARSDLQRITEAFLNSTYGQLGKAPHLLDGEEMRTLLTHLLPGAFGRKDPKIPQVVSVIEAFFDHLSESRTVSQLFEIRRALAEHGPAFEVAARAGAVAPPPRAEISAPSSIAQRRSDATIRVLVEAAASSSSAAPSSEASGLDQLELTVPRVPQAPPANELSPRLRRKLVGRSNGDDARAAPHRERSPQLRLIVQTRQLQALLEGAQGLLQLEGQRCVRSGRRLVHTRLPGVLREKSAQPSSDGRELMDSAQSSRDTGLEPA